jgi:hypothetical protein
MPLTKSQIKELDEAEALAHWLAAEEDDEPFDAGRKGKPAEPNVWLPRLNRPTQQLVFDDPADVVISYGPKYTGKGVGIGHKIFRHCWQEHDAMFLILGVSAESLGQGICHDLQDLVGPAWKYGNREPMYLTGPDGRMLRNALGQPIPNPRAGELMDSGLGIDFSRWKIDPVSKRMWMWVENRFGGKSCIRVASIPSANFIKDRITGPAPSGIMLEEATNARSRDYFKYPSLQLHRRRGIVGPQQFLMACNPEDPDHWVYEEGWVNCKRLPGEGRQWPNDPVEPGIWRDPNVSVYFCSYEENAHNVSQKNRETVERGLRTDPIEYARLVKGQWIAKPSGDALFKEQFAEARHIKGNADPEISLGIEPVPGFPLIIGYDVGSTNSGMSFKQYIQTTEDGEIELVVDELAFHRKRMKIRRVAHAILEKMRYWTHWLWRQPGYEYDPTNPPRDEIEGQPLPPPAWKWWHIAGDDATTAYNPSKGDTYAKDMETYSAEIIAENPERYLGIEPIRIKGCPKPPGSIKRRVDFTAEALVEDRVQISALCPWHRQMFLQLPKEPDDDVPKEGHKYGHIFDGYSYPRLYRHLKLPGGFYQTEAMIEVSTG